MVQIHGYVDPVTGNISMFDIDKTENIEPNKDRGMTIVESQEFLEDIHGQLIVNNPEVGSEVSALKVESNEEVQTSDSSKGAFSEFLEFTNNESEVNEIDFEKE